MWKINERISFLDDFYKEILQENSWSDKDDFSSSNHDNIDIFLIHQEVW